MPTSRKSIILGSSFAQVALGEMVEWSITAVLKTAVPRGTGGSNPSLSANKGVNQQVMRFTPFITPNNLLLIKMKCITQGKDMKFFAGP